jgi:hypothetical protein
MKCATMAAWGVVTGLVLMMPWSSVAWNDQWENLDGKSSNRTTGDWQLPLIYPCIYLLSVAPQEDV